MKAEPDRVWISADSAELYGLSDWGTGYFGVAESGEMTVNVQSGGQVLSVSVPDIITGIRDRGLHLPVLLRIENLLDAQIDALNNSFRQAIESLGYRGQYRGVYPIKVNQQCQVIEEIARAGRRWGHGLEAGSKAELLIALAYVEPGSEAHIICNGYKDEEFIELGLQATHLGYRCVFVIETPTELPILISVSQSLGIRPLLGVRVKLAARVTGHWNDSSGDRSIFGLTTSQLVELVDCLRDQSMLDRLQLLHYHLGSQIPNIRDIRTAVSEAARYYCALVDEGAAMGYIDLGGGLAVDYDGSRSTEGHSRNYTLDEYCLDVVEALQATLDPNGVAHPVIITESGRATVAYSSILLFEILDVTRFEPGPIPARIDEGEHELVHNLFEVLEATGTRGNRLQECFNDAVFYRDEIRELFRRGHISLRSRSLAENVFLTIMHEIARRVSDESDLSEEFAGLRASLADIYYGNFSVFQSLPDMWAIDQLFPVMPVQRLNEEPTREAIVADITCDSDGKIDQFIGPDGIGNTLKLHELKEDEPYVLGVFLVGAYQETLGDLHNLMGDTHVVAIRIQDDGSVHYQREINGDSIADVVSYVEYAPQVMLERFRLVAERAVREERITPAMRQTIVDAYAASLHGYTYFES